MDEPFIIDLHVLLMAAVFGLGVTYAWMKKRTKLLMPGVTRWPVVGSIFQINRNRPDLSLLEWTKELGPVYSVQVCNQTWIIVSGYDEVYEMLATKGKSFAGRISVFRLDYLTNFRNDLIFGNPTQPHWTPLRKAAYRGIHHYGIGLNRLETTLSKMAVNFVNKVASYNGKAVDLREDIYDFILKVIVTMISGKSVTDDGDKTFIKMKKFERLLATIISSSGWELDYFPWLRYFGHPAFKKLQKICRIRDQLWDEMWQESQQTYSLDGDSTCIMHSIAQLIDKESRFYDPLLNRDNAIGIFTDLVMAGISTTSNFTYLLPNVLLHNKEVVYRLQQETDYIINTDRQPGIFDREAMPYTEATIHELLRYGALSIAGVPHATLETTTVGGYTVPAGTTVIPFLPAILHDKTFWGDPENFRPERFLDSDGSLLPASSPIRKRLLAFGVGPRMCVGEAFAVNRLFIFLASMIQSFDLEPGSYPLVPCDYLSYGKGGILSQKPYSIKLLPRKRN